MQDALIVTIVFVSFIILVKILIDARTRHKLIDKGMVDEKLKYLYPYQMSAAPAALKWGMVLIGVGLAILLGQIVPHRISEEITFACMFLFAGLGMIIYYFIAKSMTEKSKK